MRTSSAKAKGRRLQQHVRDVLIEQLEIHPEDIESRSMGAGGEDLIMARAARETTGYIKGFNWALENDYEYKAEEDAQLQKALELMREQLKK